MWGKEALNSGLNTCNHVRNREGERTDGGCGVWGEYVFECTKHGAVQADVGNGDVITGHVLLGAKEGVDGFQPPVQGGVLEALHRSLQRNFVSFLFLNVLFCYILLFFILQVAPPNYMTYLVKCTIAEEGIHPLGQSRLQAPRNIKSLVYKSLQDQTKKKKR